MFAEVCHFYPGYTVETCLHTPLPVLFHLHRKIVDLLKLKGDR
jgi:hypothetical protein